MEHHCHCGFEKHHRLTKGKRLGALGATFMILHLLYHVVECLIIPAIFIAFNSYSSEATTAVSEDAIIAEPLAPSEITGIFVTFFTPTPTSRTSRSIPRTAPLSPPLYTDFFETLY